jgi:sugar phosphate isomerase/epimerase
LQYKKSISNIGWNFKDTAEVCNVLAKNGFKYVEVAPLEVFDNWDNFNHKKCSEFKRILDDFGLSVCSLQSIFYGTGLNIYESFSECINHFKRIEEACGLLECNYVVFGSPKTRNFPEQVSLTERNSLMMDFFERVFINHTINIGLEANPAVYKTNFCNGYAEVSKFVEDTPLLIHFDVGCASIEPHCLLESIKCVDSSKIRNIHLSLPYLEKLTGKETYLDTLSKFDLIDGKFLSIEMKKSSLEEIKKSITIFDQ